MTIPFRAVPILCADAIWTNTTNYCNDCLIVSIILSENS